MSEGGSREGTRKFIAVSADLSVWAFGKHRGGLRGVGALCTILMMGAAIILVIKICTYQSTLGVGPEVRVQPVCRCFYWAAYLTFLYHFRRR